VRRRFAIAAAALALACLPVATGRLHADGESVGARVTVNPLAVSINLVDTTVRRGTAARLETTVANLGSANLSDVLVTLHVQPAQVGSQGGFSQVVRQLRAGRETRVNWRLCSNTPGSYIVMVSATATDASGREFHAESPAQLLEVTAGTRSCSGSFQFG